MLSSPFVLLQNIHQCILMLLIEKKVADIARQTLKDILRNEMTYTLQHLQHSDVQYFVSGSGCLLGTLGHGPNLSKAKLMAAKVSYMGYSMM